MIWLAVAVAVMPFKDLSGTRGSAGEAMDRLAGELFGKTTVKLYEIRGHRNVRAGGKSAIGRAPCRGVPQDPQCKAAKPA